MSDVVEALLAGDASRATARERDLATAVLDHFGGRLALDVLRGGPLAHARALRLCAVVLEQLAAVAVAPPRAVVGSETRARKRGSR